MPLPVFRGIVHSVSNLTAHKASSSGTGLGVQPWTHRHTILNSLVERNDIHGGLSLDILKPNPGISHPCRNSQLYLAFPELLFQICISGGIKTILRNSSLHLPWGHGGKYCPLCYTTSHKNVYIYGIWKKKSADPKQLVHFKSRDPVHHRTHHLFLLALAVTRVRGTSSMCLEPNTISYLTSLLTSL